MFVLTQEFFSFYLFSLTNQKVHVSKNGLKKEVMKIAAKKLPLIGKLF